MRTKAWIAVTFGSIAVACGGTPGAHPTDMSATAHETAAQQHEKEASTHAAQYDPNATTAKRECTGKGDTGPCWTVARNPTTGHVDEAAEHRKMASEHRAASKALRDTEVSACAGVNETDRDISPFEHREDIVGADELHGRQTSSKQAGTPGPLQGASITIRAVPGLTKEYLQRQISCHLARNATMGYSMPEMAWCPLSVKGASATVESAGGGFRVDVTGDSKESIDEIVRRAKTLTAK